MQSHSNKIETDEWSYEIEDYSEPGEVNKIGHRAISKKTGVEKVLNFSGYKCMTPLDFSYLTCFISHYNSDLFEVYRNARSR